MNSIDKLIEFVQGGKKNCLYDIVADAICGDCEPKGDDCEGCQALKVISSMEEQLAQSALDHIKQVADEWIKESTKPS